MQHDPPKVQMTPGASSRDQADLYEQGHWRHWFLWFAVVGITLLGLTVVVVILLPARASTPWPWPGSEVALLGGLLLTVFFLGGYLTHREHLMAELRRRLVAAQKEALRESEERFRQLAENLDGAFWIKEADTDAVLYVSPAFDRIWERERQGLYDGKLRWTDLVHPEDRRRVLKSISGRGVRRGFDEVYRIVRPDSTVRWIRDRGFPVRDDRGVVFRIAGIAEDVTEERALRAHLAQSQKMEAVGHLAGGIAHDFNNLLTVIIGRTDMLARRNQNSKLVRDIEVLGQAARQAANLTRQLLTFSRKQVLSPELINVNELVQDMEEVLRRMVGEEINLTTRLHPDLAPVKADRGQVEQIILNLVINAREAMLRGGHLTLETGNREQDEERTTAPADIPPGGYVLLTVTDSGCGMDDATLAHIFEPFFTTKSSGTGLGLATVYGIVKHHGGEIHVTSAPRRGSAFQVFLPQAEVPSGVRRRPLNPDSAPPEGAETILLVEDQPEVRALAQEILIDAGYTVRVAGGAENALAETEINPEAVALILCDVSLPGVDGFELTRKLLERCRSARVLYMSGHAGTERASAEMPESELRFIQKPFTPRDLLRRVREVLDTPCMLEDAA